MKHNRMPVDYTCPEIDKHVKALKQILRDLDQISEDNFKDIASDCTNAVYDAINGFEELRTSNDELRTWGVEEAKMVDDLESELEESKKQITPCN